MNLRQTSLRNGNAKQCEMGKLRMKYCGQSWQDVVHPGNSSFKREAKAMKINRAISSAILVVLLTAPTAWGQDNIRTAMEAANKEWSAAYNSMNGKAFPALYTKDAILMPPGVQPINGSEAIGQFWTDLIKAGNRKNFAIEITGIQRDGKYAYQTGRWTIDQVKDNGEVTKVGGNTVRISEEQPDGKWLAKVHIYNLY